MLSVSKMYCELRSLTKAPACGPMILVVATLAGLLPFTAANAVTVSDHQPLVAVVDKLVNEDGFDREQLEQLFESAEIKDSIVDAMKRPAERLQWHQYRPLFIRDESISGGVEFIAQHEEAFSRAEQTFGIPAAVIAAIIGVETRYGKVKGKHRIIDSLSTLVVGYPRRSDFFAGELRAFLLLSREEKMDPLSLKGSYAGAMGIPQFISSSYRNYAIDFSGDGVRDLIDNPADAIGSIGNYLAEAGWKVGEPIAAAVAINPSIDPETLITKGRKPDFEAQALAEAGVKVVEQPQVAGKIGLIGLDAAGGRQYRAAFNNFFSIMRYNPSQLYAMAVFELSEEIERARP